MKKVLALLLLCFSGLLYGIDDKPIINPVQDGNLTIKVNKAGTITDVLKVVGSTGYVGYGITPAVPFHINGGAGNGTKFRLKSDGEGVVGDWLHNGSATGGQLYGDNDTYGGGLFLNHTDGTTRNVQLVGNGDSYIIGGKLRISGLNARGLYFDMAGSSDYIIKESSSSDRMQFGGASEASSIYHDFSSPAVGIGISNPGSYYDSANDLVMGNAATNGGMTIVGGPSNNATIAFAKYTASPAAPTYYQGMIAYDFNTGDPEGFYFKTGGGNTRMVLDLNGKLGIGAPVPATRLHVRETTPDERIFTIENLANSGSDKYAHHFVRTRIGASATTLVSVNASGLDSGFSTTIFVKALATPEPGYSGGYCHSEGIAISYGSAPTNAIAVAMTGVRCATIGAGVLTWSAGTGTANLNYTPGSNSAVTYLEVTVVQRKANNVN